MVPPGEARPGGARPGEARPLSARTRKAACRQALVRAWYAGAWWLWFLRPLEAVFRTLAALRKDPGDVVGIRVFPAYRFTRTLAFLAGAEWWTRGDDSYTYAEGQPPLDGLDPQSLAVGSGASAVTVKAGLTLAHPGDRSLGGTSAPIAASVTWERVVSASGGRLPKSESVRATLRIYSRFW